jgi:hypothetical protein
MTAKDSFIKSVIALQKSGVSLKQADTLLHETYNAGMSEEERQSSRTPRPAQTTQG